MLLSNFIVIDYSSRFWKAKENKSPLVLFWKSKLPVFIFHCHSACNK